MKLKKEIYGALEKDLRHFFKVVWQRQSQACHFINVKSVSINFSFLSSPNEKKNTELGTFM